MICPLGCYILNEPIVELLQQVTVKYYDRSKLEVLETYAAMDTETVVKELNDIIRKEEEKSRKSKEKRGRSWV